MTAKTYSIDELSSLTGLPVRTIRFYIQMELVDRPVGQRRASHYLDRHIEQLLRVKRLTEEGRSLESIRRLLAAGEGAPLPEEKAGSVKVCTHIKLHKGIHLVVEPMSSGLSSEQLRRLANKIIELVSQEQNSAGTKKE